MPSSMGLGRIILAWTVGQVGAEGQGRTRIEKPGIWKIFRSRDPKFRWMIIGKGRHRISTRMHSVIRAAYMTCHRSDILGNG